MHLNLNEYFGKNVDDMLKGYYQIVGHTPVETIEHYEKDNSSIHYIDTRLGNKEFFELEI